MVVGGAFYSERKARAIFEVWRDKEMEDWTIIVTTFDGLSCMLGSGKGVLSMLVLIGGMERTKGEYRELFESAGAECPLMAISGHSATP